MQSSFCQEKASNIFRRLVFILAECKGEAYIEKAVTLIFHPWPRREVFIFTLLLAVHNCAMVLAPMRLPR